MVAPEDVAWTCARDERAHRLLPHDIFVVYTHNWFEELLHGRRHRSLDWQAAMKISRTWRF